MTDTRIHTCPECGGDGGWDVPHGVNYHDGSPLTHWQKCLGCGGKGEVEIETQPMTLEDALELDRQKLGALTK